MIKGGLSPSKDIITLYIKMVSFQDFKNEYCNTNKDLLEKVKPGLRNEMIHYAYMKHYNRIRCKDYYNENKEKVQQKQKEYKEVNKQQLQQKQKEYRDANREEISRKKKLYREANKEHIQEKQRAWREANKEHIQEQKRQWRENNKELIQQKRKEYYDKTKKQGVNIIQLIKYITTVQVLI